jgi:peroxiredoxin
MSREDQNNTIIISFFRDKLISSVMKRLILLFAFTALISFSSAQLPHYVITGKIEGAENVRFFLQQSVNGRLVNLDTAVAIKGVFRMARGSVKYPEIANLVTGDRKKMLSFYLENSNITITGKLDSLSSAKIVGSKTQDEILSLSNSIKPLGEMYTVKSAELAAAKKVGDTIKIAYLNTQMNIMMSQATEMEIEFVKSHLKSFASPEILRNVASSMKATDLESIINAMDPEVAKTPVIADLKLRIDILKSVDIGKKAPDFTLNDPHGNKVSLSSKIGSKLLLIDFWAAWCGPCRAENPNVVKVYGEFHGKGFDIIGVSLDRSGSDWNKAISDDKLVWTHVSDLQYWNSAAAKLYGVNSIPANFLLDKNGVIIAKNLRGEALYNKVKEVINSK